MADDAKMSLLDDLIEETERRGAAPAEEADEEAPAAAPAHEEPEIETSPRRWAMDPDVKDHIAGLREGSRFELTDCGEDLDGVWRVKQLNLAHPSPLERHLYAEREEGGPPFIKMTEDAINEEMAEERLRVLAD